nr:unnamed protein product [Haemonchus contortus]
MIGNLLITINRYSALCLMNMYNEIWTRKHVLAAIIIQYFISVGVFAHAIRAHVEYIPGANGTAIIKGIQERDIDLIIRFTYIVTCIIYATTSLGLNIRLLIEWKRLTKTDGALERSHHDKRFDAGVYTTIREIHMCNYRQYLIELMGDITVQRVERHHG